jgi:hypothetical protein
VLSFDRTILRTLLVLTAAQIIGWGTVSLPTILGQPIAVELKPIANVFAGTSVLYVAMGLWAPVPGQAFLAGSAATTP